MNKSMDHMNGEQFSSDSDIEKVVATSELPVPEINPIFTFKLLGPVGENLIAPSSLSVSSSGEFVVSDAESCFVVIYDSQGNYLTHFSTIPRRTFYVFLDVDSYKPHDVDWLSSKRVVFTQPKGSRVIIADWIGKYHVTIEGRPLYEPYGVRADNSDNIYVTDRQKGRILCYNSDGKLIQTIGKFGSSVISLTSPHYIQHSGDAELFYVNHILKEKPVLSLYHKSGKLKQHLFPETSAKAFCDSLGHFIVTSDNSIIQICNNVEDRTKLVVFKGKASLRDGTTNGCVHYTECISKTYDLGFIPTAITVTSDGKLACINSKSNSVQLHCLNIPDKE